MEVMEARNELRKKMLIELNRNIEPVRVLA